MQGRTTAGSVANPSPRATSGGRELHPSQKGKEEKPFKLLQHFKAESLCLVLVVVPPSAGGSGGMGDVLGCSSSSVWGTPAPSGLSFPLPRRCGHGMRAAVPLHPLQVLPGIRCGCTGTVSTRGLRAPQTNPGRLGAGCIPRGRFPSCGWY